jgi:eukaryotic-like serine/threonine-protein kinase
VDSSSEGFDPLEEYDDLVMQGRAPEPSAFAARYPDHPDLLARIAQLDALRADLDQAAHSMGRGSEQYPASVGGYRLLDRLGQGGMGAVFAAEAPATARRCAVKLLRYGSAMALHRFQREANLAASLEHPGIARVLAFGYEAQQAYLVTELIDGKSLRELLQTKSSSWEARDAARIGLAVAEALAYAHQRGVVHRDVKPSNVMIERSGAVKLIDFGLAIQPGAINDRITRTGVFVGSHNYAAPEQLRGDRSAVGPWSDTYALGATLYELMTGRTPFITPTTAARLQLAGEKPDSPRKLNDEVPRALESIIVRALAPKAKKRWADGGEMAEALRRFLG